MRQNRSEGAAAQRAARPTDAESGDGSLRGVIDLLGALAYGLLAAFSRVEDAALAESLADKAALAEMAVAEFGHFRCSGAGSKS